MIIGLLTFRSNADSIKTDDMKIMEALHNFKCDCKLCIGLKGSPNTCLRRIITSAINLEKLDLLPLFDSTDSKEVEKYIAKKWEATKNVPIEEMYNSRELLYPLVVLDFIAGKSVYPLIF